MGASPQTPLEPTRGAMLNLVITCAFVLNFGARLLSRAVLAFYDGAS